MQVPLLANIVIRMRIPPSPLDILSRAIYSYYSIGRAMRPISERLAFREGKLQDSLRQGDQEPLGTSERLDQNRPHNLEESGPANTKTSAEDASHEHQAHRHVHRIRRRRMQKPRYYLGLDQNRQIKQHYDGGEHLL